MIELILGGGNFELSQASGCGCHCTCYEEDPSYMDRMMNAAGEYARQIYD